MSGDREVIRTDGAPAPGGPYSQAIRAGGTLYVAGQVPRHPVSGELAEGFEAQARQTFDNVKAVVEAAGASLADVVKVNVFIADLGDRQVLNEVFVDYFSEPFPARTTVQGGLPGFGIEVDAIAHLPEGRVPEAGD
jgi:2-iminobutanoate/2-iminopropanoate deaminase